MHDESSRDHCLHVARVMLSECSRRRHGHVNRDFYWSLFGWAQAARRRARHLPGAMQADLFGGGP